VEGVVGRAPVAPAATVDITVMKTAVPAAPTSCYAVFMMAPPRE
jgi:hypothetical protein